MFFLRWKWKISCSNLHVDDVVFTSLEKLWSPQIEPMWRTRLRAQEWTYNDNKHGSSLLKHLSVTLVNFQANAMVTTSRKSSAVRNWGHGWVKKGAGHSTRLRQPINICRTTPSGYSPTPICVSIVALMSPCTANRLALLPHAISSCFVSYCNVDFTTADRFSACTGFKLSARYTTAKIEYGNFRCCAA